MLEFDDRQQRWPDLPQAVHVNVPMGASTQAVPEPVQKRLNVPVPQQTWLRPPHVAHAPEAAHAPAVEPHVLPMPMHVGGVKLLVEPTQQLPSLHWLPAQHGVDVAPTLAVPHFWQRAVLPVPLQTASASLHFWLAQHGPPTTPHFWHRSSAPN
jgi:hypothetical protein